MFAALTFSVVKVASNELFGAILDWSLSGSEAAIKRFLNDSEAVLSRF